LCRTAVGSFAHTRLYSIPSHAAPRAHVAVEWQRAALVFSRSYTDEDVAILLLDDCRAVFNDRAVDRISSADLTAAVVERDGNWSWSAYQGPHDDQAPRKLSQGELARLLRPFQIRTRKLRIKGGPSIWGYYREMFEKAWSRYCPQDGTPEHSKPVKLLKVS
jgi:Protein of unknown function (DUF3631)